MELNLKWIGAHKRALYAVPKAKRWPDGEVEFLVLGLLRGSRNAAAIVLQRTSHNQSVRT